MLSLHGIHCTKFQKKSKVFVTQDFHTLNINKMGQYMAMGLVHEIITPLDDLRKKKISNEELRREIENSLLFDLELYDETETDEYLLFTLKNQVLEMDLIPFLEVLYPVVYDEQDEGEYRDLLKQLRSTPPAEWLDLAHEKSNSAFQFDEYAEPRYIGFLKDFRPSIRLDFNCVILYLGYGKISTEGIYDFADFFKHCIHETFKEHPIVKSIQIYNRLKGFMDKEFDCLKMKENKK